MKNAIKKMLLINALIFTSCIAEHSNAIPVAQIKSQDNKKIERIIYGVSVSPYVRKVLATLYEKGLKYELRETLPMSLLLATKQSMSKDFARVSPLGKIPAYQEKDLSNANAEDFFISDSDVIMNYLEDTIKANPLRPESAQDNARVSFFMKYADDNLAPLTRQVFVEKAVKPGILKAKTDEVVVKNIIDGQLVEVLNFLEKTLAEDGREWIAKTKNFSLADISVVVHISTLTYAGFDIHKLIGDHRPHLLRYVKKVLSRESFKDISSPK